MITARELHTGRHIILKATYRMQLSRRLSLPRCNGRNQLNKIHKPVLSVQRGFRQPYPAAASPALEPVRPNAAHDPTVKSVEECSDVSFLVVMAPPPENGIQFINQLLGR